MRLGPRLICWAADSKYKEVKGKTDFGGSLGSKWHLGLVQWVPKDIENYSYDGNKEDNKWMYYDPLK